MTPDDLLGGPFDTVFDVGGNVGDFAEQAVSLWPGADVWSFEPVPHLADVNRAHAAGRWHVEQVAISDTYCADEILYCVNQHSASTMQKPGSVRRELFGQTDIFEPVEIMAVPLDDYLLQAHGRVLVKIDVEGHEAEVIVGAGDVLALASTVICEVQNDPAVFVDAPTVSAVNRSLFRHGLAFAGVLHVLHAPDGQIVQFDGIWRRP